MLKPKHSAFYGTTLDVLLEALGTRTIILTGVAGNICVLFTANDAYMRELGLYVPSDCVASNTARENTYALDQMRTVMKARVGSCPPPLWRGVFPIASLATASPERPSLEPARRRGG